MAYLDDISVVGNNFTENPTAGTLPLTVQFSSPGVDSGGHAISGWNWNFGDGTSSTLQNPSHLYSEPGIFSPSLTTTNDLGGTVTGIGQITVTAPNIVSNGGFETGDFSGWNLNDSAAGWSYIDFGYYEQPHTGNYEAALYSPGVMGLISQTLSTTAGTGYLLSFWFDNPSSDTGELLVSWNGNTIFDETNISTSTEYGHKVDKHFVRGHSHGISITASIWVSKSRSLSFWLG